MHDFLYIKEGERSWKVSFSEILYLEAGSKYTKIVTNKKEYLTLQALTHIEEMLPSDIFCRIHRSYIISLLHTDSFSSTSVYINEIKLAIGKQFKGVLQGRVIVLSNDPFNFTKLSKFDLFSLFKKIGPN